MRVRWRLWPRQATGDKAYGTLTLIRFLEGQGVRASIPLPAFGSRTPFFGKQAFAYAPGTDTSPYPGGTTLAFARLMKAERLRVYQAEAPICTTWPFKERCTESSRGRTVIRSYDEACIKRVRGHHETELYLNGPEMPLAPVRSRSSLRVAGQPDTLTRPRDKGFSTLSAHVLHPGGTAMPAMVATVTPVRGHTALTQSAVLRQPWDRASPAGRRQGSLSLPGSC